MRPELLLFRADDPHIGDRVDVEPRGPAAGITLARRGDAACDHGLHVGFAQSGAPHRLDRDLLDLGARPGELQTDPPAPALEPVHVIGQSEEAPLPDPDDIVGEVGSNKAGIQDRDPGLSDGHVLAPDPRAAGGERVVRAGVGR